MHGKGDLDRKLILHQQREVRDLDLIFLFLLLRFGEKELAMASPGFFEFLAMVDTRTDDLLVLFYVSAPDPARAITGPMLSHVPCKPFDHRVKPFIIGVYLQSMFLCIFCGPCPDILLDGVGLCRVFAGVRHDYFLMPFFVYEVMCVPGKCVST